MLDCLAQAITDHRDGPWTTTAVPRLSLVATDELLPPSRLLHEPMVSFIAAGAKRTVAGSQSWSVPGGRILLNTVQVPVTAVFEQVPYHSAVLALDQHVLTELLLELGPAAPPPAAGPGCRARLAGHGRYAAELIDAVTRLVRLLDAPDDIPALAPRVESEIPTRPGSAAFSGGLAGRWWELGTVCAEVGERDERVAVKAVHAGQAADEQFRARSHPRASHREREESPA
ncbi:AraC family transcriptional regulator [Streptomyces sp. GTA36]